ncbi:hypothetical protein pipiens_002605 [Culex pipiens pipiens]|uniref:Uncharacterized protein n=1 Tax=Culex pipiens pipiens TaxID=38569 RepID=A0ABD1DBA1_CULPP
MATMTAVTPNYCDIRLDIGGRTERKFRRAASISDKFQLPEGSLNIKKGTDTELDPISGELNPWGSFTQVLAESLSELQSGMEQYD